MGKLSGFVRVMLKFGSKYPTAKNKVINPIPTTQPAFVQSLQIPNLLLILSNQSDGGNKNGAKTVKIVKLTVGAANVSITDLNVSIIM